MHFIFVCFESACYEGHELYFLRKIKIIIVKLLGEDQAVKGTGLVSLLNLTIMFNKRIITTLNYSHMSNYYAKLFKFEVI